MNKYVTRNEFCRTFGPSNLDVFSYMGANVLFDYLEELEEESGEEVRFDPIEISSSWSEYSNIIDLLNDCMDSEFYDILKQIETGDKNVNDALVFIESKTTVIRFDNGIIVNTGNL